MLSLIDPQSKKYIYIFWSWFLPSSTLLLSSSFEEEKETRTREEGRKSGGGVARSADERSVRFRSLKSVNNSHVEDNEAISGYALLDHVRVLAGSSAIWISYGFLCFFFFPRFFFSAWIADSIKGSPSIFPRYFIADPSLNRGASSWSKDLTLFRSCSVVCIRRVTWREGGREFSGEF